MRGQPNPKAPPYGRDNRHAECGLPAWLAARAYEQAIRLRSNHLRGNKVTKFPEPVTQKGRQLEVDLLLVLGLLGTENQQHGLSGALGPVQVAIITERRQIVHAQWRVDEDINSDSIL